MNRVRIEYGKAVVTALCAMALVVVSVVARTLDGVSLVIVFGALVFYFVVRARAYASVAVRRCGQRPR